MSISQNIADLRKRISSACAKAGRDPLSVTIVAVSKGRTVGQVEEVAASGIADIGENRIQEAVVKYAQLTGFTLYWHMVGHLQSNKVREAVRIFDLIQSVDSFKLADEINKQAARINKVQDILLEVKTSQEAAKSGLMPEETIDALKKISGLNNVRIRGLMTIAAVVDNPEQARPYFRQLRELRDKIYQLPFTSYQLPILSMGMSDDFEVAIEEGATMIRLGRAIFGG